MFKKIFYILVGSTLFLSAGCGLETYQSGDLPSQKRLDIVKVGFPKDKVIELLGEPAFQNRIAGDDFYIYSKVIKKSRAFFAPEETDREIYVITFNQLNTVQNIQHLTLVDGKSVAFDEEISPVKGKDLSVFEQLVKNFGRYDAGGRDSSVRQ